MNRDLAPMGNTPRIDGGFATDSNDCDSKSQKSWHPIGSLHPFDCLPRRKESLLELSVFILIIIAYAS
jgi:hypothetical protein